MPMVQIQHIASSSKYIESFITIEGRAWVQIDSKLGQKFPTRSLDKHTTVNFVAEACVQLRVYVIRKMGGGGGIPL